MTQTQLTWSSSHSMLFFIEIPSQLFKKSGLPHIFYPYKCLGPDIIDFYYYRYFLVDSTSLVQLVNAFLGYHFLVGSIIFICIYFSVLCKEYGNVSKIDEMWQIIDDECNCKSLLKPLSTCVDGNKLALYKYSKP